MNIINFAQPHTANFLVDIIVWLVGITSSVAVGIILFTLILKLVTTPFDVFSKISMRKNALKMEAMRPELEKLQKQYADNKQLYNQKMMALYKKNGYSMFGACLPTILMLVIFIVAINAFTSYSQFQNLTYFYNMSNSYNSAIYDGFEVDESDNKYIYKLENGAVVLSLDKILADTANSDNGELPINNGASSLKYVKGEDSQEVEGQTIISKYIEYSTANGYVKAKSFYDYKDGVVYVVSTEYTADANALKSNSSLKNENNKTYAEVIAEDVLAGKTETTPEAFILDIAQTRSAGTFREENSSFLWVKNIWVTDSPLAHPIEGTWNEFKSKHGYPNDATEIVQEADYQNLTAKLDDEKNSVNGYFILAVLTAGISFLMQWVTTKTQKAQMELQTVNGQGMQTQKMMMWIMPIMMAVFAFMYTAAFSIYMILSSGISILSTLGINWLVDKKFGKTKKKEEKSVIRGRVHDEEPEPVVEKKKKEEKIEQPDFITSKDKPKTHIRGRLK